MAVSKGNNLATFDTDWPADCVEWCPDVTSQDFLVCGTYQLIESIENGNQKYGCLHLLKVTNDDSFSLNHLQRVPCRGAVLDIKWNESQVLSPPNLIAATAQGELEQFQLVHEKLEKVQTYKVVEEVLLLSLDWKSKSLNSSIESQIATSDSKGCIATHELLDSELRQLNKWKAHDYEAWIVTFDKWQHSILYSGGDDCLLNGWDQRQTGHIFKIKKHSMGVTSICSNPFKEYIFASGSYDETIFLWDSRNLQLPVSDLKTDGGVWRLKWDPLNGDHLLAACMHHGVVIVNYSEQSLPNILCHYDQHESMAYGVDWQKKSATQAPFSNIASCSFYDHSLQIWKGKPLQINNVS